MPRHARDKSESGIYHMVLRGINRQDILAEDEDKQRLFETLMRYKQLSGYDLYGYCFMDNHIHLLMKEKREPLSLVLKRISSSFVYWFNWKYERCGHLFQERYKSEPVENDAYLLTVLRYIHQNPVKARLAGNVPGYQWSSYHEYINGSIIIDTDFVLTMFSSDRQKSVELFKIYTNRENNDKCLDNDVQLRLSDSEVKVILAQYGNINRLHRIEKEEREKIIKELKSIDGVTIRQLSRLTGLPKSTIGKIWQH